MVSEMSKMNVVENVVVENHNVEKNMKIVKIVKTAVPKAKIDGTDQEWTIDFGGVSQEEIIALAVRGVIIATQVKFRNSVEAAFKKDEPIAPIMEDWAKKEISVRELLDAQRPRTGENSGATSAKKLVTNLKSAAEKVKSGEMDRNAYMKLLEEAGLL